MIDCCGLLSSLFLEDDLAKWDLFDAVKIRGRNNSCEICSTWPPWHKLMARQLFHPTWSLKLFSAVDYVFGLMCCNSTLEHKRHVSPRFGLFATQTLTWTRCSSVLGSKLYNVLQFHQSDFARVWYTIAYTMLWLTLVCDCSMHFESGGACWDCIDWANYGFSATVDGGPSCDVHINLLCAIDGGRV